MAGVLNAGGGPPPAPRPDAGQSAPNGPGGGVLSAPQMPPQTPPGGPGGLGMPPMQGPGGMPGQGGPGPQGQNGPPTPTHGQTVAALRHFDAIKRELETLLKDPAVGKSNMKRKIQDGMATLVANRIVTPGAAVQQLAGVPDKPFDQRKWLQTHLVQNTIAQAQVLTDHGKAFGGVPEQMIDKTADPDNHMSDMAAVHAHYGGGR